MKGVTLQFKQRNIDRDNLMPVAKRLTALMGAHGQGSNDSEMVVFYSLSGQTSNP